MTERTQYKRAALVYSWPDRDAIARWYLYDMTPEIQFHGAEVRDMRTAYVAVQTVKSYVDGSVRTTAFASTKDGHVLSWIPLAEHKSDDRVRVILELGYRIRK